MSRAQARSTTQPLPALFCVPFIVKDNFDTAGMAATAGAVALLDNYPAQDAQQVCAWLNTTPIRYAPLHDVSELHSLSKCFLRLQPARLESGAAGHAPARGRMGIWVAGAHAACVQC